MELNGENSRHGSRISIPISFHEVANNSPIVPQVQFLKLLSIIWARGKSERQESVRYQIFLLIRATACRVGFQSPDRGSSGDQSQASQEADDRPQRCSLPTPANAGRQLSRNPGAESSESRSAATTVAPA